MGGKKKLPPVHSMSEAERKRRGLPEFCECGGKMIYDVSFGRVWSVCDTCTPVVHVDKKEMYIGRPCRMRGLPTPAETRELSGQVTLNVALTREQYACVLELLETGLYGERISNVVQELLGRAIRDEHVNGFLVHHLQGEDD